MVESLLDTLKGSEVIDIPSADVSFMQLRVEEVCLRPSAVYPL